MPSFVCESCLHVDNTARGFYWARHIVEFKDSSKNGKALCCLCVPEYYSDGSRVNEHRKEWYANSERRLARIEDGLINPEVLTNKV